MPESRKTPFQRTDFLTRFVSCFLTLLVLFCMFPVMGAAAVPSTVSWAYMEEKGDSVVLHFETPAYLRNEVVSYELAAAGSEWMPVGGSEGGSISLFAGGLVQLRCIGKDGSTAVYSQYVSFGEMFGIADRYSGVNCIYRSSDAFPQTAYLTADTITSGKVYENVLQAVPTSRPFRLYDIYFLYGNGQTFHAAGAPIIRLPLDDVFLRGYCKAYYVNEKTHTTQILSVSYDRTSVSFRSCGSGLYYIVSDYTQGDALQTVTAPGVGKVFDFYGRRLLSGDADANAYIDAADARLVLRASVGLDVLPPVQEECADIDWDGNVTAADARLVLRHSVGLS